MYGVIHARNRALLNRFVFTFSEPSSSTTESVFHAKPVKVKRAAKPADIPPAADPASSVFLSNAQQEHAEEVVEDEDTKVDLPVDQVRKFNV